MAALGRAQAVACGLLIAACASPIDTAYDADPAVDFSRFATFAWIGERRLPDAGAEGEARRVSRVAAERLRAAVEAELRGKGYEPAAPESVDLLVAYSVGREQVVREEQVAGRSTVITPGYGAGTWYRSSPVRTRTYTEGTLTLQLLDRASRQVVWVGWGSKRVTGSEPSEQLIRQAAAEILAPLPRRDPAGSPG
jgi:hypothetical protein